MNRNALLWAFQVSDFFDCHITSHPDAMAADPKNWMPKPRPTPAAIRGRARRA